MTIQFSGPIWFWRGPAPFYFVTVPERESAEIKAIERLATYGWGMISVIVHIGETVFKTSLWPKHGVYIVPLKDAVRKAESLQEGDMVSVTLEVVTNELQG